MSFKFKLGDIVVPSLAREMGVPVGVSEVTALQLDGYVEIQPQGSYRRLLVHSRDYEKAERKDRDPLD